jgi:hypothetical protein
MVWIAGMTISPSLTAKTPVLAFKADSPKNHLAKEATPS